MRALSSTFLALVATSSALSIGNWHEHLPLIGRAISTSSSLSERDACPAAWTNVSATLTGLFRLQGECTDLARGAIRAAFHDCFPRPACDGSLILAKEFLRHENKGLVNISRALRPIAKQNNVGTADLIQFAAAHAVRSCSQGPLTSAYVGRTDNPTAGPKGTIPTSNSTADDLISSFGARGFNVTELVALIGAHSVAKQFFVNKTDAGASLDSSPGTWDTVYFAQTLYRSAPITLNSDYNLATSDAGAAAFQHFVANQVGWNAMFVPTMLKLSLLGVQGGTTGLTDCTSALPTFGGE